MLKGTFDFAVDPVKQHMFHEVIQEMSPLIDQFIALLKSGTSPQQLLPSFHALENYALHLRDQKEHGTPVTIPTPLRRGVPVDMSLQDVYPRGVQMLNNIVGSFGHEPPKAAGSCGGTGSSNGLGSSSLGGDRFGSGSLFGSLQKNFLTENSLTSNSNEWFTCSECGWKADGPIGDSACGGCGITKAELTKKHPELACE